MSFIRIALFSTVVVIFATGAALAQGTGGIGGSVTDFAWRDRPGIHRESRSRPTDAKAVGRQQERRLFDHSAKAGRLYRAHDRAEICALRECAVEVTAGQKTDLISVLTVSGVKENVDVDASGQVSTDPNTNASATVLKARTSTLYRTTPTN